MILKSTIALFWTFFALGLPCYAHLSQATNKICHTHNDHLGSASWITDIHGSPTQYLHYLPYGQLLTNQMATVYDERFKFTGKEHLTESSFQQRYTIFSSKQIKLAYFGFLEYLCRRNWLKKENGHYRIGR